MKADPSLIALEGIDGAGKSTVIALLAERLREDGREVACYDFPDYDEPRFGPLVARFLRGDFGSLGDAEPWFVGMLFAGNRAERAAAIRADLAAGRTVLCDRYSYSNVAFQTAKLESGAERARLAHWLEHLEFELLGAPRPDVSFWLRVPPALRPAARARGERPYLDGRADVHESDEALQLRVHAAYEQLAESHRDIQVIECAPMGELLTPAAIADALRARLRAPGAAGRPPDTAGRRPLG